MKIKLQKGFKQFLIKTALFVALFMGFSAIIGTKLYQYGLLDKWNIQIYGRIGYIILFSIAGFIILYRDRLLKLKSIKHKLRDYVLILLSFILLGLFYFFEINAYRFDINLVNILLAHTLLFSTMLFLGLGVYGLEFIVKFIKLFKKELGYFLIFGIITASLMNIVLSSWEYFSWMVMKIVGFLLKLINANFTITPPSTIRVNGFAATIAEACSGVYSIFLFTALYLFIVFIDWNKINKKKAAVLFVPAVFGAFMANVLRVFLLFIIGGYLSRDIALGLYHSYTGMIFFLIYFLIFWLVFYKWMKNERSFIPKDSLYRNSIYLMMSTLIMSIFGFFFWIICARLYTTEQIGLATTILSVMSLITSFSLLGLGNGLVRFLPTSERKSEKINTCFTLVAIITIIITSIFLMGLNFFSPKLIFIKESLILSFLFIIFMIFSSFSSLIDSIFLAYRDTKYVLIKNSIFSVLKIILIFGTVNLGVYGIFSSWMMALISGFLTVALILVYKFQYKPRLVFHDNIIGKIGRYSFGNYIAGIIGGLSSLVLPLMITNILHPEFTAYYYMAMMIANVLFVIPQATSNSLFAEGSYNENKLKFHIKKSIKIISLLLIPGILLTIFFGKYILLFFGQDYSNEGYMFLNILALSGVFVAINYVFGSIFRIKHRIKEIIIISTIGTATILGMSYWFIINGYGLVGIGIAFIVGQIIVTLIYTVMWRWARKKS